MVRQKSGALSLKPGKWYLIKEGDIPPAVSQIDSTICGSQEAVIQIYSISGQEMTYGVLKDDSTQPLTTKIKNLEKKILRELSEQESELAIFSSRGY